MKKFIVALMVIFLSACTLGAAVTPKQKVSEFLDKYKNQDSNIISQLEETIKNDITNTDYRDRYKTLMTNQYKNMEYDIKEEIIEEDNAVVEVEITVYDYASAIRNSNEYLNEHSDEFSKDKTTANIAEDIKDTAEDIKDNVEEKANEAKDNLESDNNTNKTDTTGNYDEDKFMDYKLKQMENVTDKVKYTIEFTLTKVNGEWQLDALSNSDIEKLHGIYTG
ncbi:MAG: hypothetical protein J6B64_00415 [Bacilli bacterium]|nr:hypothetical protein [Bacilli bacterium]MBP3635596.1 hypothetical protein [Bacilli bacterium]